MRAAQSGLQYIYTISFSFFALVLPASLAPVLKIIRKRASQLK